MRLNRNTIILLLVSVIVIGAGLFLSNQPAEETDTDVVEVERGPLFPDVEETSIVRWEIRDNTTEDLTILEKDDEDIWSITETTSPLTGDVDQTEVVGSLGNLVDLEYLTSFPVDDNLADFGLTEPATTFTIVTADESEYTLQIGDQNPDGSGYYVRVGGQDETIFRTASAFEITNLQALAAAPPYVATPTPTPEPVLNLPGEVFPDITTTDVVRVELRDNTNDEFLEVAINDDGEWQVTDGTYLDDEMVTDNVQSIVLVTVAADIEAADGLEAGDLEPLGLAEPARVVTVETNTGDIRTLQIGDADPSGSRYYALVDDFETIAVMPQNNVDDLFNFISSPPYEPPAETTPEATAEATEDASE